jgi:hypothetical protein
MEVDTKTPLSDDEIETVFPGRTVAPIGQAVADDPDTEDADGTDTDDSDSDGTDSGDTDGTDSGDTDGTDS